MTFEELWRAFRNHCTMMGRSENTVSFYGTAARALEAYLEEEGLAGDVERVTVAHLRDHLMQLQRERRLGPGGMHAHGRSIRAIFNWAHEDEQISTNPARKLELVRLPKRRLPAVQPATAATLIRLAKGTDQPYRDQALIMVLFDTGVRIGELLHLGEDDLRFERGFVRVVGKGDRERTVPIGSRAMIAVTHYRQRERRPLVEGTRRLFPNRSGVPITKSGVADRLADLIRLAGLKREETAPHAFRRGFAVQFLRNGGNLFELQQILGHESLEMTRRYVTYLDEDLKAAHVRFSPGDRL